MHGRGMVEMGRKEITADLLHRLEQHVNPKNDPRVYTAREVTFDYATKHKTRVDYMRFKPLNNSVSGIEKGDVYCYEIKSSVADYRSGHGLNFLGDYNYLVMPKDVFGELQNEIPWYVGVLVPEDDGLRSVRNAKRRDREKPLTEILLMMYRSTLRELKKQQNKEEK